MVITHIPLLELYLSKLHFLSITDFILLWSVYIVLLSKLYQNRDFNNFLNK